MTGTKWWIEGDIKGLFDNLDHDILFTSLVNASPTNGFCTCFSNS